MDFKFDCSHCGQRMQCDDKFAGKQIKCPSCQHLIVIPPSPHAPAEQYSAESGKTWATFIAPPVPKPENVKLRRPGDGPQEEHSDGKP